MRLICVRHGATPLSQQKRLCGWTDVALSALGREQATRTAQELRGGGYRFTKVYASPLLRCQETARLLAPGREIIPLAEMKESFYGAFEGMDHAQAQRADPEGYRRWMEHWRTVGPPGGESYAQVLARVRRGLGQIMETAGPTETVLLVSHAGALSALYALLSGQDEPVCHLRPAGWYVAGF